MGQPRIYPNNAEKQRAYRARHRTTAGRPEPRVPFVLVEPPVYDPKPIYVYFVQEESPEGYIKIGRSCDVNKRLAGLRNANPRPMRLLATLAGNEETERALHARFGELRVTGEWFRPGPQLIDYIAEIND